MDACGSLTNITRSLSEHIQDIDKNVKGILAVELIFTIFQIILSLLIFFILFIAGEKILRIVEKYNETKNNLQDHLINEGDYTRLNESSEMIPLSA